MRLCLTILLVAATALPQVSPSPAPLVIVAPEALLPPLAPFVAHKLAMGLRAEVVPLPTALQGQGVDEPERLKRFLYARRQQDATLRYVLLVGDADVMPVRFMMLDRVTAPAFDCAFYPSDLYYADLCKRDGSFEDWNGAKDGHHAGYFGEVHGEKNKQDAINFDGIDYVPEIAVGRWPVATVAEVERLVRKTIAFELAVAKGGAKSAALVGVPGWTECRPLLQTAAAQLPADWRVTRLWWQDGATKAAAILEPSAANVAKVLGDGVGFVLHAGHGSEQGFAGSFELRQLAALRNEVPTVMLSIGCTTARLCTLPPYEPYVDVAGGVHKGSDAGEVFPAPPPPPAVYQRGACNTTSFGEQVLRGSDYGAVAYIGCDTGGQPCAATLLAAFSEALGDGRQQRLGDLWTFAVAEYWQREHLAGLKPDAGWYPPSIFFQAMKYLLLGDPSLRLPARAVPAK